MHGVRPLSLNLPDDDWDRNHVSRVLSAASEVAAVEVGQLLAGRAGNHQDKAGGRDLGEHVAERSASSGSDMPDIAGQEVNCASRAGGVHSGLHDRNIGELALDFNNPGMDKRLRVSDTLKYLLNSNSRHAAAVEEGE